MNDLRPHRVFLSNAFEPSEDEIEDFVAEERARKSTARSRGGRATGPPVRPAAAPVKKEQKKIVKLEELDIPELSDSSDDDMPDLKSIMSSAKKEKETPVKSEKGKGKVKDEFGFDDMPEEEESDSDEEYVYTLVGCRSILD